MNTLYEILKNSNYCLALAYCISIKYVIDLDINYFDLGMSHFVTSNMSSVQLYNYNIIIIIYHVKQVSK